MSLKLTLKPGERFMINGAKFQNGDKRATLIILNRVMLLREKDDMTLNEAATPSKRLYYCLLTRYTEQIDDAEFSVSFATALAEASLIFTSKAERQILNEITSNTRGGRLYPAMSICRKLFDHQQSLDASDAPHGDEDEALGLALQ
jgi:flagellar biosynthesis repressor protein FlbT